MLWPSGKFGESKWYPNWAIVLSSSFDPNYVPNEQEYIDQNDTYATPSTIVPC